MRKNINILKKFIFLLLHVHQIRLSSL
ncbi:hypothetical protein MXB_1353 [Myxobolus squamalis]|nr:hypothetical protein MXB_1353 [Myxobolus squamalis]